jgi:hypothetical protein
MGGTPDHLLERLREAARASCAINPLLTGDLTPGISGAHGRLTLRFELIVRPLHVER